VFEARSFGSTIALHFEITDSKAAVEQAVFLRPTPGAGKVAAKS
jgi:hypothetical protein